MDSALPGLNTHDYSMKRFQTGFDFFRFPGPVTSPLTDGATRYPHLSIFVFVSLGHQHASAIHMIDWEVLVCSTLANVALA